MRVSSDRERAEQNAKQASKWGDAQDRNKIEPTNPNAKTFEKLHMSK